jgi:NitT/TauT family transport system substrate-binding protein
MKRLLISLIWSAAIWSAAMPHGAHAADRVTFGTDWLAQAEHGGFYQSVADGTYARNGLDVVIKQGGPQLNTPLLMAAGFYDFALISNDSQALNLVREGSPYVIVAAFFQKDPDILMAHKAAGFASLADMKGHPVLISSGAWDTFWKFLVVKFGFTNDQGRPYTFNLAPFLNDKKLIQQGYLTSEPFTARAAGADPTVFLLADYGYSSYATMVMCARKLVAEKPELVQRFVDASAQGWRNFLHGRNGPAIELILKDNADYSPTLAAQSIAAMNEHGIVESGDAVSLGLGAMTEARWKEFFELMVQAGVYQPDLDWHAAYTLQFVNKGPAK